MTHNVSSLLRELQTDLAERIKALEGELKSLREEERRVLAALKATQETAELEASGDEASRASVTHHLRNANPEYQNLTMKELVLRALEEHFPEGATAQQMLDLFANRWGRTDIVRTSLSPQLSRLKNDDQKIILDGRVWKLAERANSSSDNNRLEQPAINDHNTKWGKFLKKLEE